MTLFPALVPPEQLGFLTFLLPQKSSVVPQKPNSEQQTLRGHFSRALHCEPQPGSHSLFSPQLDVQFAAAQYEGPRPQTYRKLDRVRGVR